MYVSKKDHETVIALEKNMYFIMKKGQRYRTVSAKSS